MPKSLAEMVAPRKTGTYLKLKQFLDGAPTDPTKECFFTTEEVRVGADIGSTDSIYRVLRQFDFSDYKDGGGTKGAPVIWGHPKVIAALRKDRADKAKQRGAK